MADEPDKPASAPSNVTTLPNFGQPRSSMPPPSPEARAVVPFPPAPSLVPPETTTDAGESVDIPVGKDNLSDAVTFTKTESDPPINGADQNTIEEEEPTTVEEELEAAEAEDPYTEEDVVEANKPEGFAAVTDTQAIDQTAVTAPEDDEEEPLELAGSRQSYPWRPSPDTALRQEVEALRHEVEALRQEIAARRRQVEQGREPEGYFERLFEELRARVAWVRYAIFGREPENKDPE